MSTDTKTDAQSTPEDLEPVEPLSPDRAAAAMQSASAAQGSSICSVCLEKPPKYKCPQCYLPYCSVACNKLHAQTHSSRPQPRAKDRPSVPTTSSTLTETTSKLTYDPLNPFHALDASVDRLKSLFAKFPQLSNQLLEIHAATLPPSDTSENKGIPAFLLRGLPRKETWNHDIGLRHGKDALRRARKADGERGEAVREYCELVLHLLNEGDASGGHAMNDLQRQTAAQDTELIARLLAEEKR